MSIFKRRILDKILAMIMAVALFISVIPTTINISAASGNHTGYTIKVTSEDGTEIPDAKVKLAFYSDDQATDFLFEYETTTGEDGVCELDYIDANVNNNTNIYYKVTSVISENYQTVSADEMNIVTVTEENKLEERTIKVAEKLNDGTFAFEKGNHSVSYTGERTDITVAASSQLNTTGAVTYSIADIYVDGRTIPIDKYSEYVIEENGKFYAKDVCMVVLSAHIESDGIYKEATVPCKVTVVDDILDIEFAGGDIADIQYNIWDSTYAIPATVKTKKGNNVPASVTYSIIGGQDIVDFDQNSNGKLLIKKTGTAIIQVQASLEGYVPVTESYTINISHGMMNISLEHYPVYYMTYGDNGNVFKNGIKVYDKNEKILEGVTITYKYHSGDGNVTVDENTGVVTIDRPGFSIIQVTATKENYGTVVTTYPISVAKADQKIKFAEEEVHIVYGTMQQYTNRAEAVENPDFFDGIGHGEGEITYQIVSNPNNIATEVTAFGDVNFDFTTHQEGDVTIKATKAACDYFNECSAEYTIHVKMMNIPEHTHDLKGEKGENGWYVGPVTVVPEKGYKISTSCEPDATWLEEYVLDDEYRDTPVEFYLQEISTGGVTGKVTSENIYIDQLKPQARAVDPFTFEPVTGPVEEGVDYVFGPINFGKDVIVTMHAHDNAAGSGIEYYKYYKNGVEIGKIKENTFVIQSQYVGTIAFKAVDKAGLESELCTYSYKDNTKITVDSEKAVKSAELSKPTGILSATGDKDVDNYEMYFEDSQATYYYQNATTVTLKITEHNFIEEDVRVTVTTNGAETEKKLTWTLLADNEYTTKLTLSNEGEHKVRLYYEDRSTVIPEKQEALELPTIVIDKTNPLRVVTPSKAITITDEAGAIVKSVTGDNEMYSEMSQYTYFYNDNARFTIQVTEKNFDCEQIVVKVNGEKRELTANDWVHDEDVHTAEITLERKEKDSVAYTVTVEGTDRAARVLERYVSPTIIIDTAPAEMNCTLTAPYKYKYKDAFEQEVEVLPSDKYEDFISNQGATFYYGAADSAVVGITVKETNFFAEDAVVTVVNNLGNIQQYSNLEWTSDGTVHNTTLTISEPDVYKVYVSYKDRSTLETGAVANYNSATLVVDHVAPTNLAVNYPEVILEKDDVNYYNGAIELEFTAEEDIAGVDYYDWKFTNSGTSADFAGDKQGKVDVNEEGKYIITLPVEEGQQINGVIDIVAYDNAGNTSTLAGPKKIVVDNVAPTRKVTLPTPIQAVDATTLLTKAYDLSLENTNTIYYYQGAVTVAFEIDDANFFAEDVVVKVNGEVVTVSDWTNQAEDIWKNSVTISNDGEYIVEIAYTDRSGNEMTAYKSDKLIVDTKAPTINVSYDNKDKLVETRNEVEYYNTNRVATITITDANFRAEEVVATVTAKDVAGANITVADFATYLKTRTNWKTSGDVHTATISYTTDANYTFDIAYTDLAKRASADYKEDKFTVDKVAPSKLSVSYSESVADNVLKNVTFGYYNQKVTVTIKATDAVSGISEFVYSYVNSKGVSNVNAELIDKAIKSAKIKQDGYDFVASFTIPKDKLTKNNQFNGTIEFTAKDISSNSTEKVEKKRIVVDNIAPNATVEFNEPTQTMDGVDYYAGDINATITIEEANFYSEDVTVAVMKDGVRVRNLDVNWSDRNVDTHIGTFTLTEDGDYVVSIEYTDRSSNEMNSYESKQLTIDTQIPTIKVEGIVPNSANKDETYSFTITVDDKDMNVSTLNAVLVKIGQNKDGKFVREEIKLNDVKTVKNGQTYKVTVPNLEEDGMYTLSCSVVDRAENSYAKMVLDDGKEYDSVTFSINRKGSVFIVDDGTQKILNNYYVYEVGSDVIIKEINVDPINTYEITLNGEKLVEGKDYTTRQSQKDDEWSIREYIIDKKMFEEEGQYNVVVQSTDKTGTAAYSDVKGLNASFVVDKTAPVITISGLKENGRYQTDEQTVVVSVSDDGGKVYSFTAIVYDANGNPLKDDKDNDISVRFEMSGEELEDYLIANANKVTFTIPSGMGNEVRIICNDSVQKSDTNEYSASFKNVTVTTSGLVMFYANKPLFYGSIAGVILLVMGIIFFIIWRNKKKEDE